MPSIALIQILQEKIAGYLQATGMTLEQLSETIDVRLSTLRRLSEGGEDGSCSFYDSFLILTHMAPDEATGILKDFFPEFMVEFSRSSKKDPSEELEQKKTEIHKESNIVRTVFQSVHHYRLYAWILAGITREDILKKFGADGITILDEFVTAQVAAVLADGSVLPIIEDVVVLSKKDLRRQAELNIHLLEFGTTESWTWTRMTGLNAHAMSEVISVMREARRQICEIMADDNNRGPLPMHLTMITDFVR
jgi:hypothetical protein